MCTLYAAAAAAAAEKRLSTVVRLADWARVCVRVLYSCLRAPRRGAGSSACAPAVTFYADLFSFN